MISCPFVRKSPGTNPCLRIGEENRMSALDMLDDRNGKNRIIGGIIERMDHHPEIINSEKLEFSK